MRFLSVENLSGKMMLAMHIDTNMCSQESVSFANWVYSIRQWIRSSRLCTAAPSLLLGEQSFASEISIV